MLAFFWGVFKNSLIWDFGDFTGGRCSVKIGSKGGLIAVGDSCNVGDEFADIGVKTFEGLFLLLADVDVLDSEVLAALFSLLLEPLLVGLGIGDLLFEVDKSNSGILSLLLAHNWCWKEFDS